MDSGLLTSMEGQHRTFWSAAAILRPGTDRNPRCPTWPPGWPGGLLARRRFGLGHASILSTGVVGKGKRRRRSANWNPVPRSPTIAVGSARDRDAVKPHRAHRILRRLTTSHDLARSARLAVTPRSCLCSEGSGKFL